MKSPLRVPSREFKCLSLLKKLIPLESVVHSFLMFDGGLELALSHDGRYVVGHTNKYVIHEFWRCVQADPDRIATVAEYFQPIEDENVFYLLQENWPKYHDPYIRAALFLLLNRYSENGQISYGKFTPERYRPTDLVSLKKLVFTIYTCGLTKKKTSWIVYKTSQGAVIRWWYQPAHIHLTTWKTAVPKALKIQGYITRKSKNS